MKDQYTVIGLMSGTSLDGLDIACCQFRREQDTWQYHVQRAETIRYPAAWERKLAAAAQASAEDLLALDAAYGAWLGRTVKTFIDKHTLKPDFIASHGHTVFHQPHRGFTYQIGNGNALHAASGVPVIYDFRSLDVMLGGQGAPLVPVGDKLLFADYDVCLNLGGIANLSLDRDGERHAFDICFCNMGLNYLAQQAGKRYDAQGRMAASGEVHPAMLRQLNKVYARWRRKRPSLGREMFETDILPILQQKKISIADKLCTLVESTAQEIATAIAEVPQAQVLCTGGGAYHTYLITRLLDLCGDNATLVVPDDEVVQFKEAIVFAFLGVLRIRNEVNSLKQVTGASRNSSGGVLIGF